MDERIQKNTDWIKSLGIPHINVKDAFGSKFAVCNICREIIDTLSPAETKAYTDQWIDSEYGLYPIISSQSIENLEKWVEQHAHNPPKGNAKR